MLAKFVFLVEMGFLHVGQAGLELLTSGDLPSSASQSAGITGVSHRARPESAILTSTQSDSDAAAPKPHLAQQTLESQPLESSHRGQLCPQQWLQGRASQKQDLPREWKKFHEAVDQLETTVERQN